VNSGRTARGARGGRGRRRLCRACGKSAPELSIGGYLEPGDVVLLADGREALVTARVEAEPGWGHLVAMLEVAIAPSRLEADDALP
jgi:hypothetical protein